MISISISGSSDSSQDSIQSKASASAANNSSTKEPLTEELLHELLSAPTPSGFINAHELGYRSLSDYLNQLLGEKGLRRINVIRAAGINETFGYQIFTGQRRPSRNKVLQIAFAMHCTLRETNRMLQAAGVSALYCKNRRDAIIIFALDKDYTLQEADEALFEFGEDTIC